MNFASFHTPHFPRPPPPAGVLGFFQLSADLYKQNKTGEGFNCPTKYNLFSLWRKIFKYMQFHELMTFF
jgi:hypothetical protein